MALCIIVFLFSVQSAEAEPSRIIDAGEIVKKIEMGQPVEYNNVIVKGDLDLSRRDNMERSADRVSINSQIKIVNSVILGDLDISGVALEDAVDFHGTKFMSRTTMTDSWFNDTVSFYKASFEDVADFSTSRFNGPTSFFSAQLGQTAYFRDSVFSQMAKFRSAQFDQSAYFQRARFLKDADFLSTKFGSGAVFEFTQFEQNAYFKRSQFLQAANFDNARFQQSADFESANFLQDASFDQAQFSQTADFESANFQQGSYFRNTSIQNALFDDIQFNEDATFDNVRIENLSLKGADVEKLDIRWSSISDLAYDDSAYNLLRKNLDTRGYLDDASDCEYSYRCKHRCGLWAQGKYDLWSLDFLAWASYGYGLRPVWPLGWSMALILMGGLFFFLTNSVVRSKQLSNEGETSGDRITAEKTVGRVTIWESLLLSATYFTSGASSIISATPSEFVPTGHARYVVVTLRLLGWIFFVIFLSSLTRTV